MCAITTVNGLDPHRQGDSEEALPKGKRGAVRRSRLLDKQPSRTAKTVFEQPHHSTAPLAPVRGVKRRARHASSEFREPFEDQRMARRQPQGPHVFRVSRINCRRDSTRNKAGLRRSLSEDKREQQERGGRSSWSDARVTCGARGELGPTWGVHTGTIVGEADGERGWHERAGRGHGEGVRSRVVAFVKAENRAGTCGETT